MGILRADRVSGLGGANAINGSVFFPYKTSGGYFHSHMEIMSDDFAVGTGNFTSECFYYQDGAGGHTDSGGNVVVLTGNKSGTNGIWLSHRNDGKFQANIHYASGSWNLQITSSNAFNVQQWYHVALVRSGSAVKLYVDGVQEASGTSSSALTASVSNAAWIGAQGNSTNPSTVGARGINGYISNVRISNEALYTAAFTAPTTRLEKLSSTLLLCCQSPGNIFKEETGKTIVLYQKETESASPKVSRFAPDKGEDHGITFADNTKFDTLSYMVPPGGTTTQSNRGRCIVSNGSPGTQALYYLQMQSGGIAQSFGNLANAASVSSGCGSATRMLVADGYVSPASTNIIEYLTIATTSNGTDYGDLTVARRRPIGMSNTTRGVWAGGSSVSPTPYLNTIDYNTIATLGNATDFGDASSITAHGGGVSSSTRGIFSIGYTGGSVVNTLEYITFATTGNSVNFGDLTAAKHYHFRGCSSSDSTRGLFAGGYNPSINTIDYITMASAGNATDFGDMTVARRSGMATGNSIDAIFVGGYIPGASNTIDKVTIQTTGNAVDLGDLTAKFHEGACSSDSHGGI